MSSSVPETWHIRGRVILTQGEPFNLSKIQAYDWWNNQEFYLGETGFDGEGRYEITYSRSQFQHDDSNRERPAVILKLIDFSNQVVWTSDIIADVTSEYTYDIRPFLWLLDGVITVNGQPVTGGIVKVYDIYNYVEYFLKQSHIDGSGYYQCEYQKKDFDRGDPSRKAPKLTFRVYDYANNLISEIKDWVMPSQEFYCPIHIVNEDATHYVQGTIQNSGGYPINGLTVIVTYLYHSEDGFHSHEIGLATTNSSGRYVIPYDPTSIPDYDEQTPLNFQIMVNDQQGEPLLERPLVTTGTDARRNVDVQVEAPANTDVSEYTTMRSALMVAGISESSIRQMAREPQYLDIVQQKTDIEKEKLEALVGAFAIMDELKVALKENSKLPKHINHLCFFPFTRTGLAKNLHAMRSIEPRKFYSTLTSAFVKKLLPPELEGKLVDINNEWKAIYTYLLSIGSYVQKVIDHANLSTTGKVETVRKLYAENAHDMDAFWKEIDELPDKEGSTFNQEDVQSLRFVFDVYELADRFLPLADSIFDNCPIQCTYPEELVYLEHENWMYIIGKVTLGERKWEWVDHIPGETEKEKKENYARLLKKTVERKYPMATFRRDLKRQSDPYWEEVKTFLEENPDFDIGEDKIPIFMKASDDPGKEPEEDVEKRAKFLAVQRMYRMSPVLRIINRLRKDDKFTSALAVTKVDRDEFVAAMSDGEDGEEQAHAVYSAAVHIAGQAMFIMGAYNNKVQLEEESLPALSQHQLSVKTAQTEPADTDDHIEAFLKRSYPDIATLFGNQNQIACEHCQSVFSPSAYLVDILQFLGEDIRNKLLYRRPDLAETDLSCTNTNGLVSYIDLINEHLEDAACTRVFYLQEELEAFKEYLETWPGKNDDEFDKLVIPSEVLKAFVGRGYPLNKSFAVHKTGDYWYIVCDIWRYRIDECLDNDQKPLNAMKVYPVPQTGKDSQLRITTPEHVNHTAYELLKIPVYPHNLPFDLVHESIHSLMDLRNVGWYQLLNVFMKESDYPSLSYSYRDINRTFLRMTPQQQTLIEEGCPEQPWKLWGFEEEDKVIIPGTDREIGGKWYELLRNTAVFLNRADLNLNELLDLLSTVTINVRKNMHIKPENDEAAREADLSRYKIESASNISFEKMARFLRLWRHLKIDMFTLDRLLCSLSESRYEVMPSSLGEVSIILRIAKDFKTDPLRVVSWYRHIDFINMGRGTSMLEKLFIDNISNTERAETWRKMINNIEYKTVYFDGGEGAKGGAPVAALGGDLPALVAGCGVSWEELSVIIMNVFRGRNDPRSRLSQQKLSVENISKMFRVADMIKTFGVSASDYFIIRKNILGIEGEENHIRFPYLFKDTMKAISDAKLKPAEVDYIISGGSRSVVDWATQPHEKATIIDLLQEEVTKLDKIADAGDESTYNDKIKNTIISNLARELSLSADVIKEIFSQVLYIDNEKERPILSEYIDASIGGWDVKFFYDRDGSNPIENTISRVPSVNIISGSEDPLSTLHPEASSAVWTTKLFSIREVEKTVSGILGCIEEGANPGSIKISINYNSSSNSLDQVFEPGKFYSAEIVWTKASDDEKPAENKNINFKCVWNIKGDGEKTAVGPRNTTPVINFMWTRVKKTAKIIESLDISSKELLYYNDHIESLRIFDFNQIPGENKRTEVSWYKFDSLIQVCMLSKDLKFKSSSLDMIKFWLWSERLNKNDFQEKMAEQTGWQLDTIQKVASSFSLDYPSDYQSQRVWLLVRRAQNLLDKTGISASQALELCPSDEKDESTQVGFTQLEGLRRAIRAKYGKKQWAEAAGPIQDKLRKLQRDALLSYLFIKRKQLQKTVEETTGPEVRDLAYKVNAVLGGVTISDEFTDNLQEKIKRLQELNNHPMTGRVGYAGEKEKDAWNLLDTRVGFLNVNALYAWFLIDPEMQPCMKTSRTVQALSSVQLFIQRILLNFESDIEPREKFRQQWSWMKNYRVWEANRKIFLYPENWLEPELRDNKTPLFEEVETALLQKELTTETIDDAFKSYVQKMEEYANLEIVGSYEEFSGGAKNLHVIGRTYSSPHEFYYRRLCQIVGGDEYWTPWEKIDLDITADVVIPVVFRKKLYIFWPLVEEKEQGKENPDHKVDDKNEPKYKESERFFELKLAWSMYTNGAWSAKFITKDAFYDLIENVYGPDVKPQDHFHLQAQRTSRGITISAFAEIITIVYETQEITYRKPVIIRRWWFYSVKFIKVVKEIQVPRLEKKIKKVAEFTFNLNNSSELRAVDEEEKDLKHTLPENTDLRHNMAYQTNESETSPDYDTFAYPENNVLFERTPETFKCFPTNLTFLDGTAKPIFYQENDNTYLLRTVSRKQERNLINVDEEESSRQFWYHSIELISNPHAHEFAQRALYRGIDDLLTRETQALWSSTGGAYQGGYLGYHIAGDTLAWHNSQVAFGFKYFPTKLVKRPYPVPDVDFRNEGANGIYNWELFFHLPMLMATRLMQDRRFEEAMRWFHFIFNPSLDFNSFEKTQKWVADLPAGARFWAFLPFFANRDAKESLKKILTRDKGSEEDTKLGRMVEEWKSEPFKPHLIARQRTVAYQKAVVMRYLDNLINWADSLFRQDTMESINEATQLYIYASEILGQKPVMIKEGQEIPPMSYNELSKEGLNSFSNTMVDLENMIPPAPPTKVSLWKNKNVNHRYYYYYYYGTQSSSDSLPRSSEPLLRMATVCSYFCIPRNDKLLSYWNTVEDRLFKIRNCMNIEGVKRQLSLFAPPIDLGMLARAAAAGINIGDVLRDMSAPLTPYRFTTLHQKAIELCREVKEFGNQILSAIEKKDSEELALLRNEHEIAMNNLIKDIKKAAVNEAVESLEGLLVSQENAETKYKHYRDIEKLIPMENAQLKMMVASGILHVIGQAMTLGSSAVKSFPDFIVGALIGLAGGPIAVSEVGGGEKQGSSLNTMGNALILNAEHLNRIANITGTMASYERRWDDWKLQEALAEKEIEQIKRQIEAARLRQEIAEYDLRNHEKQLEQSKSIKEVMTTKFSNKNLYAWTIEQLNGVHNKLYDLAYQMAGKAERAYKFELGDDSVSFIKPEYWDSSKMGLLAGERLLGSLRQMDVAYMNNHRRELEITKAVSLKMLDPQALMKLRVDGVCNISIPELIFDFDYPGHYFRRIKSVRLTMPCVTGPYTNVNASLKLMNNSIRKGDQLTANGEYVWTGDGDERFKTETVQTGRIAASSANMDAGMFDFNFSDQRYLPFEGAGVISEWELKLPSEVRQFDYNSITDVILHISYTARECGNEAFREAALKNLQEKLDSFTNIPRIFSLKQEFSSQFSKIITGAEGIIAIEEKHFPFILLDRARRGGNDLEIINWKLVVQTKKEISKSLNITINGTKSSSHDTSTVLRSFESLPNISVNVSVSLKELGIDTGDDKMSMEDSIEDIFIVVNFPVEE